MNRRVTEISQVHKKRHLNLWVRRSRRVNCFKSEHSPTWPQGGSVKPWKLIWLGNFSHFLISIQQGNATVISRLYWRLVSPSINLGSHSVFFHLRKCFLLFEAADAVWRITRWCREKMGNQNFDEIGPNDGLDFTWRSVDQLREETGDARWGQDTLALLYGSIGGGSSAHQTCMPQASSAAQDWETYSVLSFTHTTLQIGPRDRFESLWELCRSV